MVRHDPPPRVRRIRLLPTRGMDHPGTRVEPTPLQRRDRAVGPVGIHDPGRARQPRVHVPVPVRDTRPASPIPQDLHSSL